MDKAQVLKHLESKLEMYDRELQNAVENLVRERVSVTRGIELYAEDVVKYERFVDRYGAAVDLVKGGKGGHWLDELRTMQNTMTENAMRFVTSPRGASVKYAVERAQCNVDRQIAIEFRDMLRFVRNGGGS